MQSYLDSITSTAQLGQQQDSHELLRLLLDELHSEEVAAARRANSRDCFLVSPALNPKSYSDLI